MVDGDFTNRANVKAFKKHSELAKALNVYDNGKTTTSWDNKDKLTIDDIKHLLIAIIIPLKKN